MRITYRVRAGVHVKLLVTADLHYNLRQYDWMLNQAAAYDAVIVAGDLLDLGSDVDQDVQSLVVERYLLKLKAGPRVLVSSGNHDVESGGNAEPEAAWMQGLRAEGLEVDGMCTDLDGGIKISICPWWQSDAQKAKIHQKLREDAGRAGEFWIWMHHSPPDQTPLSWTGKDFKGEPSLNEWVAEFQPDLVFCGHIHNAPFKSGGAWNIRQGKTWIFNAGREIGAVPAHLIVDLAWDGLTGSRVRDPSPATLKAFSL